jgi:hypothetical protein
MGSHPWKALSAHQDDVSEALASAQAAVFARGEYGFTYKMKSAYAARGQPTPELPPEPVATSIDDAREIAAESGTCSVLDVYELGPAPSPGIAGPFSSEILLEDVGSTRPSLSEVERALDKLYERLDRGEAAYIVCYEGNQPTQYLFMGMSFD